MSRQDRRKWNKEQLEEAVKNSFCIGEVLKRLKLSYGTNNYALINKAIKEYNIDISHFIPGGKKRHIPNYTVELVDILIINSSYNNSGNLKKRLLKAGVLKNECYVCGLKEWMNKPIVCQLDHINGMHDDNRLENLRLLCPNCHSQTDTFCRKKTGRSTKKKPPFKNKNSIVRPTKIQWPLPEVLQQMLWQKSTVQIAKELGVSDKAVEKRAKKYGLTKPPRGYWNKEYSKSGEQGFEPR